MKKVVSAFLAVLLVLSMTACGGSPAPSSTQSGDIALSGEIGGEITVACFDSFTYQGFLEEAAKKFQDAHPGVTISIDTFSQMPEIKTMEEDGKKAVMITKEDDPSSQSDYISKVSTELMSGGGADIYAMDVLPFYRYAENGQLENLSEYIAADSSFNIADYRENILDASKYRDGLYFLPLDYQFDYFAYDSTLLSAEAQAALQAKGAVSYEQLIKLAQDDFASLQDDQATKLFGAPSYNERRPDNMFGKLLSENWDQFVDIVNKKANFTDGSFEQLLQSLSANDERGYFTPSINANAGQQLDAGAIINTNKDERYFFKSKNSFSLLQQFNKGSDRMNSIRIGSAGSGNEDDDEIAGLPGNARGLIPFSNTQSYGINANSGNKETAWAFLKFLLSEEMQSSAYLPVMSLPLHKGAMEARAKIAISGTFAGMPGMVEGPGRPNAGNDNASITLDADQQALLDQYIAQVEAFSNQLNWLPVLDTTIEGMIHSEVAQYFKGAKTAQEVASALQSKVELYLNE